VRQKYIKINQ